MCTQDVRQSSPGCFIVVYCSERYCCAKIEVKWRAVIDQCWLVSSGLLAATMSQKTKPQSTEENSKTWGNLSPLSGEAELNSGTETNNIRHLLNELRGLYEQRLRCLELDSTATREELLQVSVPSFRCYSYSSSQKSCCQKLCSKQKHVKRNTWFILSSMQEDFLETS